MMISQATRLAQWKYDHNSPINFPLREYEKRERYVTAEPLFATAQRSQVWINRLAKAPILVIMLILFAASYNKTLRAEDSIGLGSTTNAAVSAGLKTVKLYGAGGIAGLDAYQSGFFISERGIILTVWSTVLDVDNVIVITSDGERLEAKVVGIDPNLEIAVLSTEKPTVHFFDLAKAAQAQAGDRVLAFSNLYGIATGRELPSVQKGVVMANTRLDARRGTFNSVYQGPIYVIDAMTNNPGAAGGALTDMQGRLLGMLGKELRDAKVNIWLNYAIPIRELKDSVDRIITGKPILRAAEIRKVVDRPLTLNQLGIALIPDILPKTPAFIDLVQPDSPAAEAKLNADDLILFLNSTRITSQSSLREELKYIDQGDEVNMLIQRGTTLKEVALRRSPRGQE